MVIFFYRLCLILGLLYRTCSRRYTHFLSHFVAKDVYALLSKSLPGVLFFFRKSFFLSLFEPNSEFHPCIYSPIQSVVQFSLNMWPDSSFSYKGSVRRQKRELEPVPAKDESEWIMAGTRGWIRPGTRINCVSYTYSHTYTYAYSYRTRISRLCLKTGVVDNLVSYSEIDQIRCPSRRKASLYFGLLYAIVLTVSQLYPTCHLAFTCHFVPPDCVFNL